MPSRNGSWIMRLRHPTTQAVRQWFTAALAGGTLAAVAAEQASVKTFHVEMMAPVDITLPIQGSGGQVRYRNSEGRWRPVPTTVDHGVLHLHLDLPDIRDGHTTLLLGAPAGVDLDDCSPPRVVRFDVDQVSYGPVTAVSLGGVARAPANVTIEVRDDLNPLALESLSVVVNGREIGADRDSGVVLTSKGPRHAAIVVGLAGLLHELQAENTLTVTVDDCAIDDEKLTCSLSFGHVTPRTLQDDREVSVDSVVPDPGWREWWVIFDGERMDSSFSTTAGHTWLSAGNTMPHWVCVEFPAKRRITGVAVCWAYWQGFRSSASYRVETWDGQRWVEKLEVRDQETTDASRHVFAPVTSTAVRVWQFPMGGHPEEPQYMWISELEVLTE